MSRNANPTTLDSMLLSVGGLILWGSDAGGPHFMPDVVEQLNWSFQQRPATYISAPTGGPNWDGRNECRTLSIQFDLGALGFYQEKLRMQVKLDLDFPSYTVGAQCQFAPGETGNVRITLGAATPVVLSFTNANNGQLLTTTIAQSASHANWQTMIVELERTAGSLQTNDLRYIYLADTPNPGLPAPINA